MNFITRWLEKREKRRAKAKHDKEYNEARSQIDQEIERLRQKIRDEGGDPDNLPPRNELADFCRDRAKYYKSKM